ncbi:lysozyme [Vibrio sp. 10N.261.46.E12]|uniref:lysozyme n=1 Tax=unclassified Vibrio TaxID=2614977 RepID=UPI0009761B79|nr:MULTISPECIES: lysozyme [unclassified Vibrio]OMO36289.1 lysozyme [Vibrio sp. 10N.261.45.E1]PMJ23354.1 lysozyme [Vibrio sp. 10N.286.45.B6]PML95110.1 lysozyme [Vibrio sp. 10N.261.49.E11]PMM67146.1 lysozyme [Vibrio sp. 10N.261.46.F12]PMM79978.1 lysozyme [Vibrio sp. 10N.261.46.E8]
MKLTKRIICSVAAVIGLVTGGVTLNSSERPTGTVTISGVQVGELRTSPIGLEIIGDAEGCRQDPYTCPAGLATNGIGNTHGVNDQVVSLEQIATDWVKNLQQAEQCISRAEADSGKQMSQGQFDAFTSFSFNTGCTRFMRNRDGSETQIYRFIKQGDFTKACHELPRWVYGGGVKLKGLIDRRDKEHDRCLSIQKHQMG